MFEHMKHVVDRTILVARFFRLKARFNLRVLQQTTIHRSCGQKATGNGTGPISQDRLQALLVMQEVGLAPRPQQVVLVHLGDVGQCGLLPLVSEQVFIEVIEKPLHVMWHAAVEPPTHLIPHLFWEKNTMTSCQCCQTFHSDVVGPWLQVEGL